MATEQRMISGCSKTSLGKENDKISKELDQEERKSQRRWKKFWIKMGGKL